MDKSFTTYPALLEPDDTGLTITFPDFPECQAYVSTFDNAEDIAKKVLTDCIEQRYANGDYVPEPMSPQQLVIQSDQIPLFVPVIMRSRVGGIVTEME